MRKIKFKAKALNPSIKDWVYGYLIKSKDRYYIAIGNDRHVEVLYRTVCQLIGYDASGEEVYEGDIYQRHNYRYMIVWDQQTHSFKGWCILRANDFKENVWEKEQEPKTYPLLFDGSECITGNTHDDN